MDSNGETDLKPRVKMLTLGDFGLNRMYIFGSAMNLPLVESFLKISLCFDALSLDSLG